MTKPKAPTVDLTDLTLDELDAADKLQQDGHGRIKSYAYVGRFQLGMPDLTLEDAGKLTLRQVRVIESDPDEDDDTPSTAP